MLRIRDGEVHHLRVLFERYQVPLFNFFMRLTQDRALSEDFVQDVFVRILRYRHTYRGEGTFKGWIFNLARNVCMDHFRKNQREIHGLDDHVTANYADPDHEEPMEREQDVRILKQALARISHEYREVLVLSRYHDMKYEDIATMLGCSVAAVKVRVHRAVKALRKQYLALEHADARGE